MEPDVLLPCSQETTTESDESTQDTLFSFKINFNIIRLGKKLSSPTPFLKSQCEGIIAADISCEKNQEISLILGRNLRH